MGYTNNFYEITAHNFIGTLTFRANYLDYHLAKVVFEGLWKCEDVCDAVMINGTTGEVLHDYDAHKDEAFAL